jgi:chromate transporter
VFGGGQVLIPLMYEQFVARPQSARIIRKNPNVVKIDKEEFYTGAGIVRAIPGPVFSIASFTGGMAMKDYGPWMQVAGCVIGTIAIFLPSALLVLFFFPIWSNLKKYAAVYRALEGINAVVVGIMFAGTFYMMKDISVIDMNTVSIVNLLVITGTWALLTFTKIASPIIVICSLVLGWLL